MALLEYICESPWKRKWHVIEKFEFEGELIVRSSVIYGMEENKVEMK